jgi:hypothetical protein
MGHIFVSYSRRDQEIVDRFVEMMETAGMGVWIDRQKIQAGRLWRTQIVQAIDTCDGFVLMLSSNSAASDNVRREIDLALDSGRNIFILLLEQVKLTADMRYQLIGLQHIDVKLLGLSKAVKQLIETLREEIVPVQDQPVRQAELVIQGVDLRTFDAKMQAQLLVFVSTLANTPPSQLHIANIEAGSIHVFVDMPAAAAFDLKTRALNRDSKLRKFGIKSLRLVGDKKFVNVSLGILTATAGVGFLHAFWGSIAGKIILITSGIIVVTAVGAPALRAILPMLNVSPTPSSTPTPTGTATFVPTNTSTHTLTYTPTLTRTATSTRAPTFTATITPSPTLTSTEEPTPELIPFLLSGTQALNPQFAWQQGSSVENFYTFPSSPYVVRIYNEGGDQWGAEDSASLLYYPIEGNFEAQVLVTAGELDAQTFAALGVRSTFDHNTWLRIGSVDAVFSGGTLERRIVLDIDIEGTGSKIKTVQFPQSKIYLELVRQGNEFSFYYGSDGINWLPLVTNHNVDLPANVEIFLAVAGFGNHGTDADFYDFTVLHK